jgi:peptide YY
VSWQNQHNGFASAQSDQDPCCSLTYPITSIETDSEQHGSWSDCADAQTGLDPCWSQTHYIGFVVTRLLYIFFKHLRNQVKMSRRLMVIVCITAILISTVTCLPDAMLSPPDRPNEFRSPGQLRSYLKALNDYYAIVGRPRFVFSLCLFIFYVVRFSDTVET